MRAHAITFTDAIANFAKTTGLAPSRDQVDRVNAILQSLVTVGDDGTLTFDLGSGQTGSIMDVLASEARNFPAEEPDRDNRDPATMTATERAVATNAAQREAAKTDAAHDGNPWLKTSWNATRQAVITNRNPEFAIALKGQAGIQA